MSSEFITIKIYKNTFEQLKEYRDRHELKSISVVIQKGLDELHSHKKTEEQIEKQMKELECYKFQERLVEQLVQETISIWGKTAKKDKKVESIEMAIDSFMEIEKALDKQKKKILHETFAKYMTIIIETVDKTETDDKTKNEIKNIILNALLNITSQ